MTDPNAGSALGVDPATHRAGRHYAWLRVGRPAPDFCARVRCRRDDLTHEPGSERGVREPSFGPRRDPPEARVMSTQIRSSVGVSLAHDSNPVNQGRSPFNGNGSVPTLWHPPWSVPKSRLGLAVGCGAACGCCVTGGAPSGPLIVAPSRVLDHEPQFVSGGRSVWPLHAHRSSLSRSHHDNSWRERRRQDHDASGP